MISTQVPVAQVARWFLGRALGSLGFASILVGIALFWGLQAAVRTLGIASASSDSEGLHYEVAFVCALAAMALGLRALGRHGWPWGPLARLQRCAAELVFLVSLSIATVALAWIPALPDPGGLPWGAAVATSIHLAALAQLVSRLPTPRGLDPLLLVSLAWWIPAIQGAGVIARPVAEFLAPPGAGPMQMPGPADMAPALASALAAWLLTPETPRP